MADVSVAFDSAPVKEGDQLAFVQTSLGNTETTIEVDLGGRVRLAAVAFGSGFQGSTVTISAVVPWSAGDSNMVINGLTVAVQAGEVVPLPYRDWYWPGKVLLTVNTAQTAAHDIGFFGWRGRVE